jgi:hypothetical protein
MLPESVADEVARRPPEPGRTATSDAQSTTAVQPRDITSGGARDARFCHKLSTSASYPSRLF